MWVLEEGTRISWIVIACGCFRLSGRDVRGDVDPLEKKQKGDCGQGVQEQS